MNFSRCAAVAAAVMVSLPAVSAAQSSPAPGYFTAITDRIARPEPPLPSLPAAGSMIIDPYRPLMPWNDWSEGKRLSDPNSTGVYMSFPLLDLSILPAYQVYLIVLLPPNCATWLGCPCLFQPISMPVLVAAS